MAAEANQLAGTNVIAPEDPAFAAPANLEASGTSAGLVLGIELLPRHGLRLGLSWVSSSSATLDTTLSIANAPVMETLRRQLQARQLDLALQGAGTVEWRIPQVVNAGIAIEPREGLELAADLQWTDMSSVGIVDAEFTMRSTTLLPQAMEATKLRTSDWRVAGSGAFRLRDDLQGIVRVAWDANSVPERQVNPNNLDVDSVSVGIGADWAMTPRLRVMLDGTHFFILERDIAHSYYVESADAVGAFNLPPGTGRYSFDANRVRLSVAFLL
jgi:long-subunit fatty acid transport protein